VHLDADDPQNETCQWHDGHYADDINRCGGCCLAFTRIGPIRCLVVATVVAAVAASGDVTLSRSIERMGRAAAIFGRRTSWNGRIDQERIQTVLSSRN
jgi:hypothetical protein